MEPTGKNELLDAQCHEQETPDLALAQTRESIVHPPAISRVSDSNLVQWKQERLAHHHAYFALLDKAFMRWKRVTELRKRRRQRVIAACQVGAKFFQRLYWNQWKETIKRRLQARARAAARLQRVGKQALLRRCLLQWKGSVVERKETRVHSEIQSRIVPAECLAAERRLEVRGTGIKRDLFTEAQWTPPTPEASARDEAAGAIDRITLREKILRKIIVFHSQRQYFQAWKQAIRALQKSIAKKLMCEKADRFRVRSAWRRWRTGFAARSEYDSASRRAAFFLYYQLTKSSLHHLRTHKDKQRRERGVVVSIEARVRRRTLCAVLTMWKQRLNTKLLFSQWREATTRDRPHRSRSQHVHLLGEALRRSSGGRVLRQFFSMWRNANAQKLKSRTLVMALEGPIHRGLVREGFKAWRLQMLKQRRLQELLQVRYRSRMTSVWRAWSLLAAEKQKRELQRRTATRSWYFRTLRKAFSALQRVRVRQAELELCAEQAVELRQRARLLTIVQTWRGWSKARLRLHQLEDQARRHRSNGIVRHGFQALQVNVLQMKTRQDVASQHAAKVARRRLAALFGAWKASFEYDRRRDDELTVQLSSYLDGRALKMKRLCFHALEEYAKSRGARRIVNAHARGHYQATLLRGVFQTWNTSVAQLKWEHIFDHRAQQFRDQRRKTKCFQLWKVHAEALRREREQTKLALHHWKKVREKEAFEGWKQYIDGKRRHRGRMHAALEFRNRSHVRDGLSQWLVGAAYLAEQRSRQTVEKEAIHTARVWSRVRDIALHWRWLVDQKKVLPNERGEESKRGIALRHEYEEHGLSQVPQRRAAGVRTRNHVVRSPIRTYSDTCDHSESAISEFVMLPRNRPRPRRPIELILEKGDPAEDGSVDPQSFADTLNDLNHRYGFNFPTQPAIIPRVVTTEPTHAPTSRKSPDDLERYEGWTVDELEKKLMYWNNRRERLKTLQQSLHDFRLLLDQAANERDIQQQDLELMQARLLAMEQQEVASRRQWNESRPEIQALAECIKKMRAKAATLP